MEAILEAIFGNFMIVLIIIGGIVGFLKDKSNKGKQQQEQQSEKSYRAPRPTSPPSDRGYQPSRNMPVESTQRQQRPSVTNSVSIEERQAEQLKQLAGRMVTDTKQTLEELPHKANIGSSVKRSKPTVNSGRHQDFKKQIKGNLTRNGLVDSVVMAEVLGPPRATKPYRSVIQERRRN